MSKVTQEGVTLLLLVGRPTAGAPESDGDVGGTAVAVVGSHVRAWPPWGRGEEGKGVDRGR